MRVTVGDLGLCCCTCIMYFERWLTPLCVDSARELWASFCFRFFYCTFCLSRQISLKWLFASKASMGFDYPFAHRYLCTLHFIPHLLEIFRVIFSPLSYSLFFQQILLSYFLLSCLFYCLVLWQHTLFFQPNLSHFLRVFIVTLVSSSCFVALW